jgi:hypothetical protein
MRSEILKAAVGIAFAKMIRGGSSAAYHRLKRGQTGLRAKAQTHLNNPDADDDDIWDDGGLKGRAYERRAAQEAGQRARIGRIGRAMEYLRERRQGIWENYRDRTGRDD